MHLCSSQSAILNEGRTTPRGILKFRGGKYFYCHGGGSGNGWQHPAESWVIPCHKGLHVSHMAGLDIPGGEKPY